MFRLNGNRQSILDLIFATIDTLLVWAGALISIFLRFYDGELYYYFFSSEHAMLGIMVPLLLIQLGYYFFDLYDPKYYGERNKMLVLFLKSFGLSSVFIFIVYYLVPSLRIGRGFFVISLTLIFVFCFSWRFVYARFLKFKRLKERILIVGTGALAKKIAEEIETNGYHGFEIVGFIDEHAGNIEQRI